MYQYFVSYSVQFDRSHGFGNSMIEVDKKIALGEDIITLAKDIESTKALPANSVVILNFILIEAE